MSSDSKTSWWYSGKALEVVTEERLATARVRMLSNLVQSMEL